MKVWHDLYYKISSLESIARGYNDFLIGKKKKHDVINFGKDLPNNLHRLHRALIHKTYQPGSYTRFYVRDPKLREIHKATVPDRVVHHIVSNELEKIFEPTFIAHSYACRRNKGTQKGVLALQKMTRKVSHNDTRTCWSLKCDVKKFFASVNHTILFQILQKRIGDPDFLTLLGKIIGSHYSDRTVDLLNKKGMPIGNLTSQFFANVYLNELDQYVKHELRVKYYVRYADDFVILSHDRDYLEDLVPKIQQFLKQELDLELHPQKIIIGKVSKGIDFLGYIVFPFHILPRTRTKRRLFKKIRTKVQAYRAGKISADKLMATIHSYLGYLSHANAYKVRKELLNQILFWLME